MKKILTFFNLFRLFNRDSKPVHISITHPHDFPPNIDLHEKGNQKQLVKTEGALPISPWFESISYDPVDGCFLAKGDKQAHILDSEGKVLYEMLSKEGDGIIPSAETKELDSLGGGVYQYKSINLILRNGCKIKLNCKGEKLGPEEFFLDYSN